MLKVLELSIYHLKLFLNFEFIIFNYSFMLTSCVFYYTIDSIKFQEEVK